MSEQEIRNMRELDDIADRVGGFVSPSESNVQYNYREINNYCKERGISPIDLTIRELSNFVIEQ